MLISPHTLQLLKCIEKIPPRNMVATFSGNSCFSPTNASDETELITFHTELSSIVRSIPKHNVLIIDENMNVEISKDENNKFCLFSTLNRNGEHLMDFSLETD